MAFLSPNSAVHNAKGAAPIFHLAMLNGHVAPRHHFLAPHAGDCCSFQMRNRLLTGPQFPEIADWTAGGAGQ